jgi:hypothetical protein
VGEFQGASLENCPSIFLIAVGRTNKNRKNPTTPLQEDHTTPTNYQQEDVYKINPTRPLAEATQPYIEMR